MYIICLLVILLIITLLFLYKSFSKSNSINSINEDNNILLNKINDLENENPNTLDLFNNHASYRLGDGFYLTNNKPKRFVPHGFDCEIFNISLLREA